MKRNILTRGNGGMRVKQVIALLLSAAMIFAMLCAAAEDYEIVLPDDDAKASTGEAIVLGEDADAVEDGMDIELTDDAIPDGEALVDDALTLDGIEVSLLGEELPEPGIAGEEGGEGMAGNESNPEDFEIDENGVLVKYVGPGGDVVIPDGVTGIGDKAFYECKSLTSVTIPDGVTNIGKWAFDQCVNLTFVTISSGVTSIGDWAFRQCVRLTYVKIPDSVTSIGNSAFSNCESLTKVTIPDSVIFIGSGAFVGCIKLMEINVSENNTVYASANGLLYSHDMNQLLACPGGLQDVTVPYGVSIIGSGAFIECKNLTSVKIPDSVTNIDNNAFTSCGLESVTIPGSVISIGREAFSWCRNLTSVKISEGVTAIGYSAFHFCGLESVLIPGSVVSIDDYAFLGCELESVTIMDGVLSIGIWAFSSNNMEVVTIPASVTSIGLAAFCECENLKDVYLLADVQDMGSGAFHDVEDEEFVPLPLTIHGYAGSYAEAYAKQEGFEFSQIGGAVSLVEAKITVASQVYSGKAKKPEVEVVLYGKTLIKDTDYTVSYKNNKAVGTATVTVKGKGNYTGTVKKTFKINPKAVKLSSLKAGKGTLTVKWKKGKDITGYQLQYGLKKSFSGAKKVKIAKASTVKATLKGLKAGKMYYVRVRAYKKGGKKTYWSEWSEVNKAKVK